ncbi:kinase-like protein [Schizopora paradoxa]|uniref:Kinase-like protein n=1 Tax=Schizopora paradoxa TaxID=27342 RepID=A0A0H2S5M7_9AGAM|nr:kinase-like protein [Schizopora paradoxa]
MSALNLQDVLLSVKDKIIEELTSAGVPRYTSSRYASLERIFEAQNTSDIWVAYSRRHPSKRVIIKAPSNEVVKALVLQLQQQSPTNFESKILSVLLSYYRHECGSWRKPGKCEYIVPLYGFTRIFEGSLLPALIVRYVPAGDLPYFLHTKVLPEKSKLKLLLDVAQALEYLHARDVEGIRLWRSHIRLEERSGGELKALICNFGSSSFILNASDDLQSIARKEGSAIAYRSPEFYRSSSSLRDPRILQNQASQTDMWSFGCLFSEVMQEDDVWGDADPDEIGTSLEKGEHPPAPSDKVVHPLLDNCARSIKAEYWSLILSCWEVNPERRITAKEMRKRLQSLYDNFQY